jgi:hypothetical protein
MQLTNDGRHGRLPLFSLLLAIHPCGPDSARRRKATSKPIVSRPDAAHTYDDRCLSWNYDAQTVSIWTLEGRIKNLRFACSPSALKQLIEYRRGEVAGIDVRQRARSAWVFVNMPHPTPT